MGSKLPCTSKCNYPEREQNITQPSEPITTDEYVIHSRSGSHSHDPINTHRYSLSESTMNDIKSNNNYNHHQPSPSPSKITCNSVTWCISLHRLIDALKFYDIHYNNNQMILNYCNGKNCKHILNDYHHIITHHLTNKTAFHLNYEFELIYNEIIKYMKPCNQNIKKCEIFSRNRRTTRETEIQFDTRLGFYVDIMDMIHCYFMHSYDIGMRRKCSHIFMEQERLTERLTARSTTHCTVEQALTAKANTVTTTSPAKSIQSNLNEIKEIEQEQDEREETDSLYLGKMNNGSSDTNQQFVREKGLGLIEEEDGDDDDDTKKGTEEPDMSTTYDLNLIQIKNNIKLNRSQRSLVNVNAKGRNNKFFSEFNMDKFGEPFGYRYYYWNGYRHCDEMEDDGVNIGYKRSEWYIAQKYHSLKEEILNNQFMRLTVNKYEDTLFKGKQLMDTEYIKGLLADCCGDDFNDKVRIRPKEMITVEHIMSVVLYCDYPELSYHFSATFRKIRQNEDMEQMKLRNREYWNWSKLLIETVELYGVSLCNSETEVFYHGISHTSTFKEFQSYLAGPTSTSPFIEVVEQFMCRNKNDQKNGIMLELERENEFSNLKIFNCATISFYPFEDERLFMFGRKPLKYYSLIMINDEYENYRWFIKAIHLFNHFINGQRLSHKEKKLLRNRDYEILNNLMEHYHAKSRFINKFPDYVNHLFASFVESKKRIIIDLGIMNEEYVGFQKYLMSASCHNLLRIDYMMEIFRNCEQITIYNTNNINFVYSKTMISMLSELNQSHNKSLKQIKICNVTFNDQTLNRYMISKQLQLKSRLRVNAYCDIKMDTKYRVQYDDIKNVWVQIPEYSDLIIIRDFKSYEEQSRYHQTPIDRIIDPQPYHLQHQDSQQRLDLSVTIEYTVNQSCRL